MSNPTGKQASGRRRKRLAAFFLIIAVLIAAGIFVLNEVLPDKDTAEMKEPVFNVTAGPLTISVNESGTIQSRQQIAIKSEVEGQTTILFLVPEGTQVKKDDLLIELDGSKLEDSLVEQQIRAQNTEAAFIRSRENLEVVKNQAKADIAQAELDFRFAQEDKKMYLEGEYPKTLKELQSKIALAEEELQRAKQKYDGSKVLFEEKYISQTELQADGLAAKKAQLNVDLAQEELKLLEKYTHKRRLDELEAALAQEEMALERVSRKATADVIQAEAELKAKEAEYKQQEKKLQKINQQMEKTKIRAPRDGLVVYASSTQATWRGNQDPLDEGQVVRERQELIYLPTADAMMAQVKIPEARLETVRVGLPARVHIDALPGRVFTGEVAKIAPLPDATSMFMNPDLKVYNTEIHLQGADKALRPGMSCTVEIVAAHYPEALYVPVHAVVRHGNQPVAYVHKHHEFVPQPIEIGLDNNRMVHVLNGISSGDVVLLNPPLSKASIAGKDDGLNALAQNIPKQEPPASVPEQPVAEAAPAIAREAEKGERERGQENTERSPTPKQREEFRQRMQNMTPEERENFRKTRENRRTSNPPANQ